MAHIESINYFFFHAEIEFFKLNLQFIGVFIISELTYGRICIQLYVICAELTAASQSRIDWRHRKVFKDMNLLFNQ